VNTAPAKADGFWLRLIAQSIGASADCSLSKVKSSSDSSGSGILGVGLPEFIAHIPTRCDVITPGPLSLGPNTAASDVCARLATYAKYYLSGTALPGTPISAVVSQPESV